MAKENQKRQKNKNIFTLSIRQTKYKREIINDDKKIKEKKKFPKKELVDKY